MEWIWAQVLFPRPDLQQRPVACLSLEELLDAINDEQMFSDKGVGLLKMSTSAAMSSEGAKASTWGITGQGLVRASVVRYSQGGG